MKLTKNTKLIFLFITAFVISLVVAFSTMNFTSAKADGATSLKATDYFSGISEDNIEFVNGVGLEVTVKNGDVLSVKNKLAVNGLTLTFKMDDGIDGVQISYKGASKYATGAKQDNGKLSSAVTSKLALNKKDSKVTFNGSENTSVSFSETTTVKFVNENSVEYDGAPIVTETGDEAKYNQKDYNGYDVINLEFKFTVGEGTAKFTLTEVKVDATNTQSLVPDNEGNITKANPVAIFPTDKFALVGSNIVAEVGYMYKDVKVDAYSLMDSGKTVTLECADNEYASNFIYSKDRKEMCFNQANASVTIKCMVGEDEVGSFNVKVTADDDITAPVYRTITDVNDDGEENAVIRANFINAFLAKLVNEGSYTYDMTTDTYTISDNAEFVSLGSSKYLELPSFEDMVSDETSAYSALKYTVHYTTPTTSSTNSKLRIPLNAPGKYSFYVTFEDSYGNGMKTENFYVVNEDDSNYNEKYLTKNNPTDLEPYGNYIFEFSVKDNAPIEVEKAEYQGSGYVGVKFTAAKFEVVSSSYTETYTLLYSNDKDAADEAWIEIPKASTITDESWDNEKGFDYDDIKAISYDGKLTFTPDRVGYYKIKCQVQSDVSGRNAEATSEIIEVTSEPKVVKPDSKWLQNNVWSVVFLSVGTLCLIGIIVLLFIKPKEKTEGDSKK